MAIRSTFAGLNTMYRGVTTQRLALDTVGHNLTNANVDGYSRQRVNQAAVSPDSIYANGYKQYVGAGVDSLSITRARDVYADKQYWHEESTRSRYETREMNYQKLEAIFNDSDDTGIGSALTEFYQSLSDWSTVASDRSERVAVLEKARLLVGRLDQATLQLQTQITALYSDIEINVERVNTITDQIVQLNKNIMAAESVGGPANDLRDSRDLLVDELSGYMSISMTENADNSMYTIVSNGASIVNGIAKIELKLGPRDDLGDPIGTPNPSYGISDYNIELGETHVVFDPLNGKLRAEVDAIGEDKAYIDKLANMAAFLLDKFNEQHRAGIGIDEDKTTGLNFFDTERHLDASARTDYEWHAMGTNPSEGYFTKNGVVIHGVQIINELVINPALLEADNEKYLAGGEVQSDTADGSNAVLLAILLTEGENGRYCAIGESSFESYYNANMTGLGVDSAGCSSNLDAQEDLIEQIQWWRTSTAGVNWDEELTNMIQFQTGYKACSRCLTAMDELLNTLINGMGVVGR